MSQNTACRSAMQKARMAQAALADAGVKTQVTIGQGPWIKATWRSQRLLWLPLYALAGADVGLKWGRGLEETI